MFNTVDDDDDDDDDDGNDDGDGGDVYQGAAVADPATYHIVGVNSDCASSPW